jgi:hypothetical protein
MQGKYLLLYGGNTTDGEHFDHETLLRFYRAVRFIAAHPGQYTIILAAGYRPDKPMYRPQKFVAKETLEELFSNLTHPPNIWILEEDAWSTFGETVAVSTLLQKLGSKEICVCSTWIHLLRIKVIWKVVAPSISVRLIGARSKRTLPSLFWEIGGFIKLIRKIKHWRNDVL